jgi:hypothetical protein
VQPGFRGAEGNAGEGGDFGKRHAIDESQQENFAMVGTQAGDDLLEIVVSVGLADRCGELIDKRCAGFATEEAAGSAREVSDGGVEEGPQLAAQLEAGELAEEIAENLLHHVLREVLAAAVPAGHAENPLAVAMIEPLEGLFVARIDSGYQFLVVGGIAGWLRGYQGGWRVSGREVHLFKCGIA